MERKGFTLVEFIVASTIFVVVMTVAIGSFAAISKLRIQIINMKETQQKSRVALETIIRYAKDAQEVDVQEPIIDPITHNPAVDAAGNTKYGTLILKYNSAEVSLPAKKIQISGQDLSICDYSSCTPYYLLGNSLATYLESSDPTVNYFVKESNTVNDLKVNLKVKTTNNTTSDDGIVLNDVIMLDGENE